MAGPPPKDASQRRRRNATPGFKALPHVGRTGPAPEWPLSLATHSENEVWDRLWRLPQAVEWERMRCEDMVALYVRAFIKASDNADPKMLAEVRQLDAKIGLSPKAMRDLRWETDEPLEEEPEEDDASTVRDNLRSYVPRMASGAG